MSVVAEIAPSLVPAPLVNTTVSPPVVRALLAASRTVSVSVADAPETTLADDTVTVDCASDAAPGVTVIVGSVDVTAPPPMVAPIVRAVPAVLAVNVAVYAPFPLSEVAAIVPSLVPAPIVKTTESPPVVNTFPDPSRAVSVKVTVPPDWALAVDTDTSDWASDTGPGVTVTVGKVDVTELPPIVAPIVRTEPNTVARNVAVYVPFALSVVAEMVPSLVPAPFVNATASPPVVSALLAASRAVSVSVTAVPMAALAAETVIVDCAAETAPGTTVTLGRWPSGIDVPLTVTLSVDAEPAVVAVNVVEYTPLPFDVTAENVPLLAPPVSENWTVTFGE